MKITVNLTSSLENAYPLLDFPATVSVSKQVAMLLGYRRQNKQKCTQTSVYTLIRFSHLPDL